MDQLPEGMHVRRAHRRNGRLVRATIARNPRRRRKAAPSASLPPSSAPPRRGKAGLAIGLTVAATIGFFTITGSLGGSASGGSDGLSVQVNADLRQAVALLTALGFRGTPNPSYGAGCAGSATGGVGQFLARHPCKEYASATLTARKQGATAQVVISWVVMPDASLAGQYKAEADAPLNGNPPGESLGFDGRCYASGQDGATVWTEQVQPTGPLSVSAERQILQAAAPGKLTPGYLQQHCIG